MKVVSFNNLKLVLAEFIEKQILNGLDASSPQKWVIGGFAPIVLLRLEENFKDKIDMLIQMGLMDKDKNLDIELTTQIINNGFRVSPLVKQKILGTEFSFTLADGQALIDLLNRFGEDHGENMARV